MLLLKRSLGIPQTSRDTFEILQNNKIIGHEMSERLRAMIGFRNIAIHNYQRLNLKIIQAIIEKDLKDLLYFTDVILKI